MKNLILSVALAILLLMSICFVMDCTEASQTTRRLNWAAEEMAAVYAMTAWGEEKESEGSAELTQEAETAAWQLMCDILSLDEAGKPEKRDGLLVAPVFSQIKATYPLVEVMLTTRLQFHLSFLQAVQMEITGKFDASIAECGNFSEGK